MTAAASTLPAAAPRRRRALRAVSSLLRATIAAAVVIAWLAVLRPTVLGGPATYVLVNGCSMCPTYSPGDLVVTMKRDRYVPGEIVAYRVPPPGPGAGHIVIHRIAGRDGALYVMRGDANGWTDPWHVTATDLVGVATARVPGVGRVLLDARNPALFASLAATGAFCLVAFRRLRSEER